MGCATSIGAQIRVTQLDNTVDDEFSAIQGPPPKIPMEIGSGIRKLTDGVQSVIFMFGKFLGKWNTAVE